MASTNSWKIGRTIFNGLFGDYFMRDDVSDAQTVITFPHHEIHEGDAFFIEDFVTLGSGGTMSFSVDTPDSAKQMHMFWDAMTTEPTELRIYEYGSTSTGGTTVLPINHNRSSAGTSDATITYNATIVDIGTSISGKSWGFADTPSKSGGGEAGRENELVLGTNRQYIYHFVSKAAGNVLSYHANWYEHTPSN